MKTWGDERGKSTYGIHTTYPIYSLLPHSYCFFLLSIENKGQYKAWDVAVLVEDTHSMHKVLGSIASTT